MWAVNVLELGCIYHFKLRVFICSAPPTRLEVPWLSLPPLSPHDVIARKVFEKFFEVIAPHPLFSKWKVIAGIALTTAGGTCQVRTACLHLNLVFHSVLSRPEYSSTFLPPPPVMGKLVKGFGDGEGNLRKEKRKFGENRTFGSYKS